MLGPLVVVDGDRHLALPRGHARALLALLALRAGEVVSTERLIDQLWGPTPPPTAAKALHGLVSILRRRLEPDRDRRAGATVVETRAPGYVLSLDRDQVDAHRFRSMLAAAAGAPAAAKAALLREALELWRGPALDDFAYEPFAQAPIADLEESRLTALEERVEADLALNRHAELVAELEGLTAEHPLRERLRGQLLLALYRCGRQAEALEVYRDAQRLFVDELGIEPSPALQALQRSVLIQDPALDAPGAPVSLETRRSRLGVTRRGPGWRAAASWSPSSSPISPRSCCAARTPTPRRHARSCGGGGHATPPAR
jgi:DNA-binding SARP family transcriptional activator